MFFVYILYSQKSDIFYVGHTDDVQRRLEEHNALSTNSFTSRHRPWELKAAFPTGPDRSLAMKVERHLKKQKSCRYLNNIISTGAIDRIINRYSPGAQSGPDVHRD